MSWTFELLGYTIGVLDIITIVLVLTFGVETAIKGILYKISSLTATIVGLAAAVLLTSYTKAVVLEYVDNMNSLLLSLIVFVSITVLTYMVVFAVGKFIKKIIEALHLGFVDNALGFIFGSLFTLICISAVCQVLSDQTLVDFTPLFNNSLLFDDYIKNTFSQMITYVNI